MTDEEKKRLDELLSNIIQLIIAQIEAQMNLSTSILLMDDIPSKSREDAQKAFSSIQEQLNLLNEIKKIGQTDV
ncbi:hypothetical protein [Pseudomonas donghuensis]|uniref:hypothetical protein n=1 Tax=Pseudomonas donghuensis TaxID=1163398 RepID=UPI00029B2B7A|nr:hypothetical protein [Pseudomonas donghuensis]